MAIEVTVSGPEKGCGVVVEVAGGGGVGRCDKRRRVTACMRVAASSWLHSAAAAAAASARAEEDNGERSFDLLRAFASHFPAALVARWVRTWTRVSAALFAASRLLSTEVMRCSVMSAERREASTIA